MLSQIHPQNLQDVKTSDMHAFSLCEEKKESRKIGTQLLFCTSLAL